MTAESDFRESMVHAEALAAAMRDAGLRAARAWGRQGAGARVYFADQYVTVSRGGDVSGHYIAPGTRARLTFDTSVLYPAQRKAFTAALKAYRAQRDAYMARQGEDEEAGYQRALDEEAERLEYRMEYRPSDAGVQAHDLRSSRAPAGLLDRPEEHTRFGGLLRVVVLQLARVQGKPDEKIPVYRMAPAGDREIHPGDWVSLSPDYARGYLERVEGGRLVGARVPARTVRFGGYDLMEWSYWGPTAGAE